MKSILPWSFSSMEGYETCPRRYYETKLAKNFVEQPSEAIKWGNHVHKALELRVRDKAPLPANCAHYEKYALAVERSKGDVYTEKRLAVTQDLQSTDFFAADCWSRGVEDVLIVNGEKAASCDYKTGKKKPKSKQLQLSALRVFANYPNVQVVTTAFIWLASGEFTRDQFERTQAAEMWKPFIETEAQMAWSEEHDAWPAKPSGLCRKWCPVTTCPHNGGYRR